MNEQIKTIEPRFRLVPFSEIKLGTQRRYLVKGLIPRVGITVVWGPPKSGKSFWTFDAVMHVALGWEYRGRRVHQGPVVYCAFEGQSGIEARVEAFRLRFLPEETSNIPFYLEPVTLDLVKDHPELIAAIGHQLGDNLPVAIVLDTLNRSLQGSESNDEDMSAYVKAADSLREAFHCAVIIVHHCGIAGDRPRGHTSLSGAVDAQLSVKRDSADNILLEVELMKDGPQGEQIASRLECGVEVGTDEDGDIITSCIVTPADKPVKAESEPKLSKNQQTMFAILHSAGSSGLKWSEWNEQAREEGIGIKRKADLFDIRRDLKAKGLVRQYGDTWVADR
jgi:hypothetical protein